MIESSKIVASDMQEMIQLFPDLLTMIPLAEKIKKRAASLYNKGIDGVCLVGMGGSSITGEICRGILASEAKIPIITARDYYLPGAVNENWVVIAVSYSGNTEETLAAFHEAQQRKCHIFGVTTGGRLATLLNKEEMLLIPSGLQPRAALPLMLSLIYTLLTELVHLQNMDFSALSNEVRIAIESWKGNTELSPSWIAQQIQGKIPLFIGWQHLSAVAYRAKCQINENAKAPAMAIDIPEMDHNEIEACGEYETMSIRPIFLRSIYEGERVMKRIEATKTVFKNNGTEPLEISLEGSSRLAEALIIIRFLDEVSLEYAKIRGADPLKVERITNLKKILSRDG